MSVFRTPIDIANRACQHCGVRRIDPAQGFAENSRQAKEIYAVFDGLRRAEMERNTWRFTIRKALLRALDTDTMLLAPAEWSEAATYFVACIVQHDGLIWICRNPDSSGNEPGVGDDWQLYFGPLSVSLWDSTIAYTAGELVYTTDGDGTNRTYLSLQDANTDNPATSTQWDATATYRKDDDIMRNGDVYRSAIDLNINQDPLASPDPWASGTSYSIGNQVGGSDGMIYTSLFNANLGNDPVSDAGVHWTNTGVLLPWTTVAVFGTGSAKWRQIGGAEFSVGVTLTTLNDIYPIGSGPSSQATTRNIFRLPANYVKYAPQDPKAGSTSWLGAPTTRPYDDWDFQDIYIVSRDATILFRFAADVAEVKQMNAMFCEGLAARIALEVCEILTQSTDKLRTIGQVYEKFMGDARRVNAVEIGPVEQPLDDWLACRA